MMIRKIVLLMGTLCNLQSITAQVGIGTTSPNNSAIVDVSSSDKGILLPRMTTTQRNAIVLPAEGLMIYNITENCLEVNSGTGASPDWACVSGTSTASFTNDCDVNGFEGTYTSGVALTGTNKFSVTVTNTGASSSTLSFLPGDLVLSGVSGITVSAVNPPSVTLASSASQLVEYTLTGTPGGSGTLQGIWSSVGLSCTKTVPVATVGDATFSLPDTVIVISINDGVPVVDVQGVVDNAANQYTISLPYTGGTGTYSAYTGTYVANNGGTGEGGDVNSFRLTYPSGTFSASGSITATIEVDGDGSFNAEKQLFTIQETIATLDFQVNGVSKGNVVLDVFGGIPDRNVADASHRFIYLPVIAADGNVWLNNNLGANYANVDHVEFDPVKQAASFDDFHAYGNLIQWGRYTDGHDLVTYTNGTTGTGDNGTTPTTVSSDTPGHSLFITNAAPADWRSPQNDLLWQGETGTNNPCPSGYRLPVEAEILALISAEGITNYTNAASSNMAFSTPGFRVSASGNIDQEGVVGYYFTSTPLATNASYIGINVSGVTVGGGNRGNGMAVRCIQD